MHVVEVLTKMQMKFLHENMEQYFANFLIDC